MSITFSSADLARLERLSATLLSPLDAPTIDDWRRDACFQLRELVGGDKVYFLGEGFPEEDILWCDGFPDALAHAFRSSFRIDEGLRRVLRLGNTAFNQTTIIAGDWKGYNRDPMVNEVYRPSSVNDVIGLLSEINAPDSSSARSLRFQLGAGREVYGTEEFGDKGLQMMRLLAPSFEAGIGALLATAEWRVSLGSALDALNAAAWVLRGDGRTVLHRNAAAARLVDDDPASADVEASVADVAMRLAHARHPAKSTRDAEHGALPASTRVRTDTGTYVVRGSYLAAARLGGARAILVIASRLSPRAIAWPTLRREYALTTREVDVARLLYGGLRTSDIARRLGMSAHTARHHIERLYMKLGVHTRGEAQRLIRES